MDPIVRWRAENMLKTPLLFDHKHLPKAYVVRNRIFAFRYAAEAWREEMDPMEPIEVITIEEAYKVLTRDDLPEGVEVDWKLSNK